LALLLICGIGNCGNNGQELASIAMERRDDRRKTSKRSTPKNIQLDAKTGPLGGWPEISENNHIFCVRKDADSPRTKGYFQIESVFLD
jgi:hypothetical protein